MNLAISARNGLNTTLELTRETFSISKDIFKILIPAVVIVKILQEFEIISILSKALHPLMQLFGLPGEMSIVWTTAIVTNIYGAIAVLLMFPEIELSVAQMTVLSTMILVCHSLPVELALTHKVGCKYSFLGPLRFLGACIAGYFLNLIYSSGNFLTEKAVILWADQKVENSLSDWIVNQLTNFVYIFIVLFCLLAMMRFFKFIGFTNLLAKILKPILIIMGISPQGASISVFGLLAGITFGSGLLLAEVRQKSIPARDIVLVLAFLSLCHGIIEDTALMLLLGADIYGILGFRFAFSILVLAVLSRVTLISLDIFESRSSKERRELISHPPSL